MIRRSMLILAVALVPGFVRADSPDIGTVQKLKVITFSLQVSNTDRETKRVTYTPAPGWYVRSHAVECLSKHGNVTFSVSTVPQQWRWSADEHIDESNKVLLDAVVQAPKLGGQARMKQQRSYKLSGLQSVRATHHALILDVTAKGEGLLRSGAGLELVVTAELVYLGMDENPCRPDLTADDPPVRLGEPVSPPK